MYIILVYRRIYCDTSRLSRIYQVVDDLAFPLVVECS